MFGSIDQSDLIITRDEIMEILDQGPGAFDAWLATLPQDKAFNVHSACECFFHNYILAKAEVFVWTFAYRMWLTNSNPIVFPDNYRLPLWYSQFQDVIMGPKYDEDAPLPYKGRYPSTARKVLRDVVEKYGRV
jgi:hypothetical protein